jgi:hypothetical protein
LGTAWTDRMVRRIVKREVVRKCIVKYIAEIDVMGNV